MTLRCCHEVVILERRDLSKLTRIYFFPVFYERKNDCGRARFVVGLHLHHDRIRLPASLTRWPRRGRNTTDSDKVLSFEFAT